jgi:hypothetical protein
MFGKILSKLSWASAQTKRRLAISRLTRPVSTESMLHSQVQVDVGSRVPNRSTPS